VPKVLLGFLDLKVHLVQKELQEVLDQKEKVVQ
jgi:hypothetical protein